MTYEQLQEEYEQLTSIAYEVSGVLALAAGVLKEPLEKDEVMGLVSVLLNYTSLIDGFVLPRR
jgi:hypothetical protein